MWVQLRNMWRFLSNLSIHDCVQCDYEDSKKDGHFEIAGNNAYEKAGNILQIGGGIADVVGVGFPPAKLLGGVLDLAATATNEIGESLDTTDTDKLSTEQTQETQQTEAAPAETITTGRVQWCNI